MGKSKKKENSDVEEETNDQEINEKDTSDDDYCEDNYEDDKLEDETEHCSDATYLARKMLSKERLSRADSIVINFGRI